ncbi:MAG: PfkB family carbohydrate kinase [Anaerolineae bacterium]
MRASTYLVVGHITQDVTDNGFVLGGTATYSAVTAANLGLSVRVLTAGSTSVCTAVTKVMPAASVTVNCLPSPTTTTFCNTYSESGRQQQILSVATPLSLTDLPASWLASDVAHLGPIAQEVAADFLGAFPKTVTLGVTPQGWLRSWDGDGHIASSPWLPTPERLATMTALVLSVEDVGGTLSLIEYYARHCPITVITQGYRGCTLLMNGESISLPTRPAVEIDPTGAGDVFAAAFFVRLHETQDPVEAARFANVVGSFSVEGVGTSAIPQRSVVESWLAANSAGF